LIKQVIVMHNPQHDTHSTTTLAQHQAALADHIRDPEQVAPPAQVDERRVGIYRDLVFNNVESQLSVSFPVINSILTPEGWLQLVREFLRDYRAQTPYFSQLSAEFVDFLSTRQAQENDPDFLLELAHYERIELDLFMMDREISVDQATDNELLNTALTLVNVAHPLVYQYPVHQISPEFLPETAPEQPTCLLLFQDDDQEVRFFELQLLAYHLVVKLSENQQRTGQQILAELAEALGIQDNALFYQQGEGLLKQLHGLNVLIPCKG
jgi:hypothetical protein